MTNINFDVDDYTDNELLDIAEISQDASSEVIDEKFTEIIKQYLDSKNFRLAQFFHDAKEKVLDNLSKAIEEENIDNTKDESIQAEEWLKNQYRDPIDNSQEDKITDRRHNTSIFDGNIRQVMSQKRLGISNNYPLNISQDSLNPTLRQTVKQYININSNQRSNSVPFINNLNSKNSSSNFIVNLNNPIKNVVSMRVESYNIPNTIYTFDPLYGNNVMMILISTKDISMIDWENPDDISCCTRVNLTPGSYKRPIDFVNQLNLDITRCQKQCRYTLFGPGIDASGVDGAPSWDPEDPCAVIPPANTQDTSGITLCFLSLQAHLLDPLSVSPRIVFINSSTSYHVKIVFYKQVGLGDTLTPFDNYIDCSLCNPTTQTKCPARSTYKNNLGYIAGYRIERVINDNGETIFLNTNTKGSELSIILEKAPRTEYYIILSKIYQLMPSLDGSLAPLFSSTSGGTPLQPSWFPKVCTGPSPWANPCPPGEKKEYAFQNHINPLLLMSYTMQQYAEDIASIIYNTNNEVNFYSIANVPVNLVASEYIYICVNDFNQNRPPDNVITVANQITNIEFPSYRPTRWSTKTDINDQILDLSADIICYKEKDVSLNSTLFVPSWPKKLTQAQIYSLNEINSNNKKQKDGIGNNSSVTDVMVSIPYRNDENIITTDTNIRLRQYFGPVKIDRLEISLKDSRGNLVNLNGQDWALSIVLEQLYQY